MTTESTTNPTPTPISFDILLSIANRFADEMPVSVMGRLGDVEILVCEDPDKANARLAELLKERGEEWDPAEDSLAMDTKGAFVGLPAELSESEDSEEEEIEYDPEGFLVLCASNLYSPEEATITLLHEFGHALGMDEDDVRRLGLGPSEVTEEAPNAQDDEKPDVS